MEVALAQNGGDIASSSFDWWPYPDWGQSSTQFQVAGTSAIQQTLPPQAPITPTPTYSRNPSPSPSQSFPYTLYSLSFIPSLTLSENSATGSSSTDFPESTASISSVGSQNSESSSSSTTSAALSSDTNSSIHITALPPASETSPIPIQPSVNGSISQASSFKPIYLVIILAIVGAALGALFTWWFCSRRKKRRAKKRDQLIAGPEYTYATADIQEKGDAYPKGDEQLPDGPYWAGEPRSYDGDGKFGSTGKWLAGILAAQQRSSTSDAAYSRAGTDDPENEDMFASPKTKYATFGAMRLNNKEGASLLTGVLPEHLYRTRTQLPTRRVSHTRADSDVYLGGPVRAARVGSYHPDAGYDSEVELRVGMGPRPQKPVLRDPSVESQVSAQSATTYTGSSPGFRVLREDPETGAILSRVSSVQQPAPILTMQPGWAWPSLSAVAEGVVAFARGGEEEEGDKFTPLPARKSSRHSRKGSVASHVAPLASPTSVYSTAQQHQQAQEVDRANSGARLHAERVSAGGVLAQSPSVVSSPQLERALSFGDLRTPASPTSPSTPKPLYAYKAAPASRTHGSPAQRYAARHGALGRVEEIISRGWVDRAETPASPTMFGAMTMPDVDVQVGEADIEQRLRKV